MAYIKLEPNVVVTGTPKYADLKNGQYGTQIKLKGDFDGQQGVDVYLPDTMLDTCVALGVLHLTGQTDQKSGNEKLRVTPRQITLCRRGPANSPTYEVKLTNGAPAQQPPQNGQQPPQGQARQQQGGEPPVVTVARLKLTMAMCIKAAREIWKTELNPAAGEDADFIDQIASTAHTLFISRDRRELLSSLPKDPNAPPPPKLVTDSQQEDIQRLTEELGSDENLGSRILAACGARSKLEMTEEQAKTAIRWLQNEVEALMNLDPPPPGRFEEDIPF
jgi:hypothetical protein